MINIAVYYHYHKVDSGFMRDFFFLKTVFLGFLKEVLKMYYLPTQHLSVGNSINF